MPKPIDETGMNPQQQLAAGVAALGLALPEGAEAKLMAYLGLLEKWNRVHNLTAVREADRMVSQHLLDSLAVTPYFLSPGTGHGRVLDVGSGGGLPGIPLAIARPQLDVTLIDSIAKKTAFLLQAKAELGLDNVTVVTGRVEDFRRPPDPNLLSLRGIEVPQEGEGAYDSARASARSGSESPCGASVMPKPINGFDFIISRAFSDLKEFVTLTRHLLAPGGRWLAMKGLYPNEEITQLPSWVKVSADHPLAIPGLDATRHLIALEPVL